MVRSNLDISDFISATFITLFSDQKFLIEVKDTCYNYMVLKPLKIRPPWYILLDYITTKPSFKNLSGCKKIEQNVPGGIFSTMYS